MNKILEHLKESVNGDCRLSHFFAGAWIVAVLMAFKWEGVLGGFILTMFLEMLKNGFVGDKKNYLYNISAALLGCLISAVLYLIQVLI